MVASPAAPTASSSATSPPKPYEGGPLALVQDGDKIIIDAVKGQLTLDLSPETIAARRKAWQQPAPKYTTGVLAKYAALVSTASEGAMTDAGPPLPKRLQIRH